jgi:SET domain-containing protein
MLLVPAILGHSPIHGLGVMAAADISKGTAVWQWDASLDREIPWITAKEWPQAPREFLEAYGYRNLKKNTWMLAGDDSRYMNHSFSPNVQSGGPYGPDHALRDIKAGEELTIDYRIIDPDFDKYSAEFH